MYRFAFFILLSLAASTAFAATKKSTVAIDLDASFAQQKAQIEQELGDGETYAEISSQDRATVREALNRIASKLDNAGGVESLSSQQKADVFNDQEKVNTILTKASEDSRQICTRVQKVGSHRTTTQCTTVGQKRRDSEESLKAVRDSMGIRLPPPG
jgi:Skp family chaperone for outer membrane proteins